VTIPRVFHQIWIGSPLPEEYQRFRATWKRMHPDWELKLWDESNLTTQYPELIKRCKKLRHRANIYRYELLARNGGVYVDTDFVCLKNIEPLLYGCSLFAAQQVDDPTHPNACNNAIFGCSPGHPAMVELVREIPHAFNPDAELNCGPELFTRVLREYYVRVLPKRLFYPYSWEEPERRNERWLEAYAVHHWGSKHPPAFESTRVIKL
jgi:mannosyltransferase OCH1-like enzyme